MNYVLVGMVISVALAGVNFIASQNVLSSILVFLITNAFFARFVFFVYLCILLQYIVHHARY